MIARGGKTEVGRVPVVISVADPEDATAARPRDVFAAAASAEVRRVRPNAPETTPSQSGKVRTQRLRPRGKLLGEL